MQSQLFPPEIIENTTESYLPSVSVRSQSIYIFVLLAIIGAFASTPFIFVDVSVQSNGVIRTVAEKNEIRSLVSGLISVAKVKENTPIMQGQTLFVLKTDVLDTKIRLNSYQQNEKRQLIQDLSLLVKIDSSSILKVKGLMSPLCIQQYNQFRYTLQENIQHQRKVKKELDTDRFLYKEKVIAMREFDEKEYAYNQLVAEYRSSIERQITLWQSDLSRYQIEFTELEALQKQLLEEKEQYVIKASATGTIQQLTGKYVGSSIQAGENLGIISPDSNLLVECYVSPQDIGFLRKDMQANFQINSFNYNQWGLASGKILNVANDFIIQNQKPVFKVQCLMDKTFLKLKTGYVGKIKKGMNLRARFIITRRSIYQLMYDKVDDWVNPKV
jgi:membrane fusion protein, peptide pheromone/bacteriocin exporter